MKTVCFYLHVEPALFGIASLKAAEGKPKGEAQCEKTVQAAEKEGQV
jgi:hypothetical protein